MDLGLAGKNVIVTGGSKGIGKHIALGFAREGASVAICARNAGPLHEAAIELRSHKGTVYAATCDIGNTAALDTFLEEAGRQLFISSGSGLEAGSPPAYAAAKAAIISYSKTLSVALAPQHIRVNTLALGSIEFGGGQ